MDDADFLPGVRPPYVGRGGVRRGLWFCVEAGRILVSEVAAESIRIPEARALEELGIEGDSAVHFLGQLGGRPCWGVAVRAGPDAGRLVDLRALWGLVPGTVWAVAGRAAQIVEWDRTHRYCGRCGARTVPVEGERARRCPVCGLLGFPRLEPAVIVGVERAGEILLARNTHFPGRLFSVLAGFVEPGETAEDAVRREVAEEVGIRLSAIRYVASQPWPFPHSLMLAFTAEWAGGELRADGKEIAEAGWFRPDALPEQIPEPLSIARTLIDDFVDRQGTQPRHGARPRRSARPRPSVNRPGRPD